MLELAHKASGVAKIHVAAEAEAHAGSSLIAITNGVFEPRWRAKEWSKPPLELSDAELWHMHNHNRQKLLVHIAAETGTELDPDILTVVWAWRMTAYKRPELLVSDLKKLEEITKKLGQPIQFIVSGAANPADSVGIDLMNRIITASQMDELQGRLAYLPHYNPASARLLVQGADLWLNTPIRGQEACGTSGMKASLNGALQFSTSDGWIDEVDIEPIGWRLSDTDSSASLYHVLEHEIAPLFYTRENTIPISWVAKMRNNIALIEQQFTAKRMLDEYYEKLYT
jgi:glycogen phosphorylase